MEPVPLYYVWDYTDVDRAFWAEHLEDFVPRQIIDAHTHIADPALRIKPMTEAKRRQYWVAEACDTITAENAQRCTEIVLPGREVTYVAIGHPDPDFDIEGSNEYVRTECLKRSWHCLALLIPQWSADRVAEELAKPGVIGVKPYYTLIGASPDTRDEYLAAHPICEYKRKCRGAPSVEVDHVVSRRAGGTDKWHNLRAACKACHSSKTARLDTPRRGGRFYGTA